MEPKQKTIRGTLTLEGIGLHTGKAVKITLKPAEENAGILFRRVDLPSSLDIKADFANIVVNKNIPRCTSLGKNGVMIHTVEHLMAVLSGLEIDNLLVEINEEELPGLDGSSVDFLTAIKKVGIQEQKALRSFFAVREPIWVEDRGSSVSIVPADDLKISYLLDYEHPFLDSQFFDVRLNPDSFEKQVAMCRTFCLEDEADELKSKGLGKGANFQNTLVVGKKGVKENRLRFDNEFARHKVLDLIGDLYLLGRPLKGHIVAVKSGHHLNFELLKKIASQKEKYEAKPVSFPTNPIAKTELDISAIMKLLPHRYPFLFVDRIIEIEKGQRAVGLKNVTFNELFFQGHFPSRPVMPGVLMIEAMAQVGGVAVLAEGQNEGKVPIFMSVNNVKFRKIVSPGDQLVIEAVVLKKKSRMAQIHGEAKVQDQVVVEADMMFSYGDATVAST